MDIGYEIVFAGYGIAFYMIWGGMELELLSRPDELLFMLYRLMLVDEWPYDDMMSTNKTMTYLLVGSYLMVVAILLLNLFIALLSDTFQRIYDNAVSNASMQSFGQISNGTGIDREPISHPYLTGYSGQFSCGRRSKILPKASKD